MLRMTPSCTFYMCVKNGDKGKQAASIRLTDQANGWATFSIKDEKSRQQGLEYRTLSVDTLGAAVVYIHDSDKNYMCYVNWYSDTNEICFDVSRDDVHIHRYKQMAECGFQPDWEFGE